MCVGAGAGVRQSTDVKIEAAAPNLALSAVLPVIRYRRVVLFSRFGCKQVKHT